MFSAILALLILPFTDLSNLRGIQFRPLSKIAFYAFIANFLILMQLGAKHVESPFIEFGQISTVLYFLYFTVVMYGITLIENTFSELNFNTNGFYQKDLVNSHIRSNNNNIKVFFSPFREKDRIIYNSVYKKGYSTISDNKELNNHSLIIFVA